MLRPGRAGLTWLLAGLIFGQLSMFLYKPQDRSCTKDERDPLNVSKPKNPPIKLPSGAAPLPSASNAPHPSNSVVNTDVPEPSFADLVNQAVDVEKFVKIFSTFNEEYYQMLNDYCSVLAFYAESKLVRLLRQPNSEITAPALAQIDCKNPEYTWMLTGEKRDKPVRIFDMFLINSELDLLEVRLNELNGVVDKFVFIESTFNHRWAHKPLYYGRNKEYFKKFWPSILHIVYDDADIVFAQRTTTKPANRGADFTLEILNRRKLFAKLREAYPKQDGDLMMLSDVDEIPDRNLMNHLKYCQPKDVPLKLSTEFFFVDFNMTRARSWTYPTIGYDEHYFRESEKIIEPSWFRFERNIAIVAPKPFGWHLNRFTLPELMLLKELSMSETTPPSAERLRNPLLIAKEIANWPSSDVISAVNRVSGARLPWFVAANPNKYPYFFDKYWQDLAKSLG